MTDYSNLNSSLAYVFFNVVLRLSVCKSNQNLVFEQQKKIKSRFFLTFSCGIKRK
jgi:hypothetical protein